MEIVKGRVYRAKKPAQAGWNLVNDRQVIYINTLDGMLQYDGPAVANGRKYPRVSIEAFIKWAARDVTDELPKDEWAQYTPGIK